MAPAARGSERVMLSAGPISTMDCPKSRIAPFTRMTTLQGASPPFTFDGAGNQHIEQARSGITTNVWNYENQRTGVLLPSGQRETMTYNADFRNVRTVS